MSPSGRIGAAAIGITCSVVAVLQWRARAPDPALGFWFADDVTFALHDPRRVGGVLAPDEMEQIRRIARQEVEHAFAPLGIEVTGRQDAPFRVAVKQVIRPGRGTAAQYTGAAGQSFVMGPLGNYGSVNFQLLAAQAMSFAPAGATRPHIIEAIGRGVGRAAIHEFTHQLLPLVRIDAAEDEASYEFGSANRRIQYYGELHWTLAEPKLRERYAQR